MRDEDEDQAELAALKIPDATVGEIREWGAAELARATVESLETPALDGFWVHLDADVLDPSVMPAVDSPDAGGLLPTNLRRCCGRWSPRRAASGSTSPSTTPTSTRTAPRAPCSPTWSSERWPRPDRPA